MKTGILVPALRGGTITEVDLLELSEAEIVSYLSGLNRPNMMHLLMLTTNLLRGMQPANQSNDFSTWAAMAQLDQMEEENPHE